MPRVSQNHDGSPKRRLQPLRILDEPLKPRSAYPGIHVLMYCTAVHCTMNSRILLFIVQGNVSRQTREAREQLTRKSDVNLVSIVHVSICSKRIDPPP
jgi:hypothetical protein